MTKENEPIAELHLMPAYGRKYSTATEAQLDWSNGRDFKIFDRNGKGPYTSIADIDEIRRSGVDVLVLHFSWDLARLADAAHTYRVPLHVIN